ncbi:GNAT family N-acetyltransferase [Flavobacterium humi]|uniref:N-acetyltransferase n=1 Tax=Flavobacterium humi TaxID=2562683 RepID=A0A4Z0L5P1_9FLAO|nr:GNAT family N-acetyltransferase [Flavobacterium humi]TGD57020.1 N-acetyltransferase [Flavobacterium humi]
MTTNTNPTAQTVVFQKEVLQTGLFELRPIDPETDLELVHQWVNLDYAVYWGMTGFSLEEVKTAYQNILKHSKVYMGLFNSETAFLLECYNPSEDLIGNYYTVDKGDKGMHILVAPAKTPIKNFTWNVFTVIMDFLFSHADVKRIVVEPDVRNDKIHLLNQKAGFEYQKIIELPHKTAHLAFCTQEHYHNALQKS